MNSPGMKKPLVIFGSAEIATLARYYFENDSDYRIVAFTVDDAYVDRPEIDGLPLLPFSQVAERFPPGEAEIHVALSYKLLNRRREEKFHQAKQAGYRLASYISSRSVTWPDLKHGENCFILENQTLQPTVELGDNVMLWSGNHIGHGTHIASHAYVASHVCISGHCRIGERSFLGVNSAVRDFCTIGADCFIAMQAAVMNDVPDGGMVLGQGGEVFPADDRRTRMMKRKFFNL